MVNVALVALRNTGATSVAVGEGLTPTVLDGRLVPMALVAVTLQDQGAPLVRPVTITGIFGLVLVWIDPPPSVQVPV